MGKTLKTFKYRGVNLFIRHVARRQYEVLVAFRGWIYCQGIRIEKNGRLDTRLSNAEVDEWGIDQGLRAGIQLIDNLFIELSYRKVAINLLKNLWQKTKKALTTYQPTAEAPKTPDTARQ